MTKIATVTAENMDQVAAEMAAIDQAAELAVGCQTWPITYSPGGQGGQMTVWPCGRGAVAKGADSAWGDWDEDTRTLTLDDGGVVDEWGDLIEDEWGDLVVDDDDSCEGVPQQQTMIRTRADVVNEVSTYIVGLLAEPAHAAAIAADLVRRADAPVDGEYRLELPGRGSRDGNPVPFTVPAEASAV